MTARELLQAIRDEADRDGGHYQPCLRDCLGSNAEWVEGMLVKALAAARREGAKAMRYKASSKVDQFFFTRAHAKRLCMQIETLSLDDCADEAEAGGAP